MKSILSALALALTLLPPSLGYAQQSSGLIKTPHDKKIASLSWNEFNRQFRCPESLANDKERELNINDTNVWFATNSGQPLTLNNLITFRMKMLTEHNCTVTLNNIAKQNATSANNTSQPGRYLCKTTNGTKTFDKENMGNCISMPLEKDWKNIVFSNVAVVDVLPSKIVREGDNVKIWSQFYLAKTYAYTNPQFNYDRLKQISRFLCKSKQVQLIQGTYMLGEKVMYDRLSNEMITEEIEPGTINETIYNYACK